MKIYIDNYNIDNLKTKLIDLKFLFKKSIKYKKIISKYHGVYNVYDNVIYKLDDSNIDLKKIYSKNFIFSKNSNKKQQDINIIIDNNEIKWNEIYSYIPLNHFILPITEYQYYINKNIVLIIEMTTDYTPFDFYFIFENIFFFTEDDLYLQEEFTNFLNILF